MMASGMPVAFSFMMINLIGVFFLWGGIGGLEQIILSIYDGVVVFALLPLPLFILMGEVMFHSGIAPLMLDALDKWLGRLPGRLGLLSVGAGSIFATLTGVDMATVAVLGSVLPPEMEKRGYKKSMSLGPILGAGALATMIPPSVLAVLFGSIALVSVGNILMAIIFPGILMAFLYATYIIVRCKLQPSIAPPYAVPSNPISERLVATMRYVLPVGLVIFLVIGVIFLGIATPTEAAATGTLGTFILVLFYRRMHLGMLKNSFSSALKITVMMFMIIVGANAFSQILAFTGAIAGLTQFTMSLHLPPILVLIAVMLILLLLGTLMEQVSIMMITLPLFVPLIKAMGFDVVWFAVIFLITSVVGTKSPPFGLSLFVMKGVAPPDTTMGDIYRASLPFVGLGLIAMVLIIAFPQIALWLPAQMR